MDLNAPYRSPLSAGLMCPTILGTAAAAWQALTANLVSRCQSASLLEVCRVGGGRPPPNGTLPKRHEDAANPVLLAAPCDGQFDKPTASSPSSHNHQSAIERRQHRFENEAARLQEGSWSLCGEPLERIINPPPGRTMAGIPDRRVEDTQVVGHRERRGPKAGREPVARVRT